MRRPLVRFLISTAAVLCAAFAVTPAAAGAGPKTPSGPPTFTIYDSYQYEYAKSCVWVGSPTLSCGRFATTMTMSVSLGSTRPYPITIGYVIEPITATPGADYSVAASGTITIPANRWANSVSISIVDDGVAEGNETLRMRMTSSSVGGNISDTGIGTIRDDGAVPPDCDFSIAPAGGIASTVSLTCTNRPATQKWKLRMICGEGGWGYMWWDGNTVTGNGVSSYTCGTYLEPWGFEYVPVP